MIALKTSPLFFGHEIFLVFHLFLIILYKFHDIRFIQTVQCSEGTTYYLFFLLLHCLCQLSMEKKLEFSGFLSYQALYFVILYQVIWKGLIIVSVILVIAAFEGMSILLLHWFAIRVRS